MYSEGIKRNCRKVWTGLKGKEMLSVLQSVEGQLSDGIWENSPRMEGYWLFETTGMEGDDVYIYISNDWGEYRWNRPKWNAFCNMTDYAVRCWFANKIKQIIKQEQKDNWPNHPIEWKRDCEEVSLYMHDDLTVRECYRAYDRLLGRPQRC